MVDQQPAAERFRHLPEPVRLEDTVPVKDASAHSEVYGDPERDFMLRYAG